MTEIRRYTSDWIKNIKSNEIFTSSPIFIDNLLSNDELNEDAPFNVLLSKNYEKNEKKSQTPARNPVSVYDGLQTTINMCRSKSQYNPLAIDTFGTKDYFNKFTQEITSVPYISLMNAIRTTVKEESHNSDKLINEFAELFIGISEIDLQTIKLSLKKLVQAALSYSSTTEKGSYFTQNILDESKDNKSVYCNIYSSTFTIKTENNKGTINFESSYDLIMAQYSLARSVWDNIKDLFEDQTKTTAQDWINSMTTPVKKDNKIILNCLD